MFYAKSTGGFYREDIHGPRLIEHVITDPDSGETLDRWTEPNPDCKIPLDAVEISPAEHAALLSGQAAGKSIVCDADGRPLLQDPPASTLADLKADKNAYINTERAKANSTSFEHVGKAVACDPLSRSDIDGVNGYVAITGALPPGFPGAWKAIDNSYVPIADVAAWTAFYGSMVAAGATNFAHAQELKATLAAAQTPAAVAAITW